MATRQRPSTSTHRTPTQQNSELAALPFDASIEKCDFCTWRLCVRTNLVRRFRCIVCRRWLETPIHWITETVWRTKRVERLPDQTTIFDALGEGAGADKAANNV